MSDATYSVSFGGITFDDTDLTYRLVDAQPAKTQYRRATITGPYTAGDVVLAEVQDVSSYQIVIRCVGGTGNNAGTLYNELLTAGIATVSLSVTLNGASETYVARPPDISCTAEFEALKNNQRVVTLTFPTQPFPT